MRKLLPLLLIALMLPAAAGEIIQGRCAECGYEPAEYFYGSGMLPGWLNLLYRDPESGLVYEVDFLLALKAADEVGVNINNNHREIQDFTESRFDLVAEIHAAFNPPEVLEELAVDGELPRWVELEEGFRGEALSLVLVENPERGRFTCPECGAEALGYEQTGYWD
jgi:hypothetical protein